MYHNYLVFGKIYCKHFVQRSSNNAKQTDGLARPASQSAKLQTCLPPSHVDRRGSHVQWENPPRSVSYASVHVVEQVSLPSASIVTTLVGTKQTIRDYAMWSEVKWRRKVHQDLTPLHLAEG